MTAAKTLGLAAVLFLSLFATHQSAIGDTIIGCDSSLVVYCATADVLGTGVAWVLWHGAFSLAIAWAIVALSRGSCPVR